MEFESELANESLSLKGKHSLKYISNLNHQNRFKIIFK